MEEKKVKYLKIIAIISLCVIILTITFTILYKTLYYRADNVDTYLKSNEKVSIYLCNEYISFSPKDDYEDGFIFYPGAFVEAKSYSPIMYKLAERGIYCAIVKVPLCFALLKINAANRVLKDKNDFNNLYVGGHSLGGVAASQYYLKNEDKIKGVIFLASYTTKDISKTKVLSIYGDRDGVINKDKYEEAKSLLPKDYSEYVIEGGNHAQFGKYGKQKKDNDALISLDEQIDKSVELIIQFIKNNNN